MQQEDSGRTWPLIPPALDGAPVAHDPPGTASHDCKRESAIWPWRHGLDRVEEPPYFRRRTLFIGGNRALHCLRAPRGVLRMMCPPDDMSSAGFFVGRSGAGDGRGDVTVVAAHARAIPNAPF